MKNIIELQRELVQAARPSGFETPQAAILKELARPFADEVTVDTLGNVICHKKGPGKRLMIAAHMDVIGFMVTFIDECGFLRFEPLGGHMPARLVGTPVRTESGVCGSIWADAEAKLAHAKLTDVDVHDLYIDIGAKSREEAERLAPVGSVCVYDALVSAVAGGNLMTPYADDLIGCVTLLLAMEQMGESKNDVYFVFSVQEEVGCRGAVTAAWQIDPYMGISCDVCPTGDTPGEPEHQRMQVALGKGPAVKIKDGGMQSNPQTVAHLRRAAEAAGVVWQDEILLGGSTDARSMQVSRSGVLAGCVSIPCRNVHTPAEMVNLRDVEQAARLLARAAMLEL